MIPKMIMNILLGWRPSETLESRGDVSGHMINKYIYLYSDIFIYFILIWYWNSWIYVDVRFDNNQRTLVHIILTPYIFRHVLYPLILCRKAKSAACRDGGTASGRAYHEVSPLGAEPGAWKCEERTIWGSWGSKLLGRMVFPIKVFR